MVDLKGLLNSCNWTLSFENPEWQEKLGSRIESCEADVIGGETIVLFSPILNKSLDIKFCDLLPIVNGYRDLPNKNQIVVEPSGITIKSYKYGIIRMVEYSEN